MKELIDVYIRCSGCNTKNQVGKDTKGHYYWKCQTCKTMHFAYKGGDLWKQIQKYEPPAIKFLVDTAPVIQEPKVEITKPSADIPASKIAPKELMR